MYTVRAPVTDDGRPNTAGVTDGLNAFADEVSEAVPSVSFSPVMRFGKQNYLLPIFMHIIFLYPKMDVCLIQQLFLDLFSLIGQR